MVGTTPGKNVDGASPPWNFNVCTILTASSPMSSAIALRRGSSVGTTDEKMP